MIIAILGWGSLIWKPQNLPHDHEWKSGGPTLPLEFSMVADNRKLSLVIDPIHGVTCPTRFAFSPRNTIDDAIEDLRKREGTTPAEIGYVDMQRCQSSIQEYPQQIDINNVVCQWCSDHQVSAAVWTAMPPNFLERLGKDFSIDAAIDYLKRLPEPDLKSALAYIRNTPSEVDTPLRRRVDREWSV